MSKLNSVTVKTTVEKVKKVSFECFGEMLSFLINDNSTDGWHAYHRDVCYQEKKARVGKNKRNGRVVVLKRFDPLKNKYVPSKGTWAKSCFLEISDSSSGTMETTSHDLHELFDENDKIRFSSEGFSGFHLEDFNGYETKHEEKTETHRGIGSWLDSF